MASDQNPQEHEQAPVVANTASHDTQPQTEDAPSEIHSPTLSTNFDHPSSQPSNRPAQSTHVPSSMKQSVPSPQELEPPRRRGEERKAPSVSVMAHRSDLRGAIENNVPKNPILRKLKSLRAFKRVLVEGTTLGTKDSVFFAPDHCLSTSRDARGTATSFVNVDPRKSKHTVYRGDPFEITFLGMSVSPQDIVFGGSNDLMLYSLTKTSDPLAPDAAFKSGTAGNQAAGTPMHASNFSPDTIKENCSNVLGKPPANMMQNSTVSSSQHFSVPTGIGSVTGDVPFIHYDPVVDGHDLGAAPDSYVPVPATKAVYLRSKGKRPEDTHTHIPQSVSLRFTIKEVDKVSDLQARAVPNVDQTGNYVSSSADSIPYLELLTRAFTVANSLGKSGLKKYAKPGHIHSVDMEFLLAERDTPTEELTRTGTPACGNYLQYGYYFFLSDKVDAKLYAQTCSSSQSVPLLVKREGFTKRMEMNNEKEYFPLSGISYLVVKVTKGVKHPDNPKMPELRQEHKRRLDNMLQMSNVIDLMASMHNRSKMSGKMPQRVRR